MERLIVKNFIVLKDIEIDINKINIFIGQQATGKSLISKLLYYFKDSIWEIYRFIIKEDIKYDPKVNNFSTKKIKDNLENYLSEKFIEYFQQESVIATDFFISYENSGLKIIVESKNSTKVNLSDNYIAFIKNHIFNSYLEQTDFIQKLHTKLKLMDSDYGVNKSLKSTEVANILKNINPEYIKKPIDSEEIFIDSVESFFKDNSIIGKNQIFIPSGRAFFSIVESNIFSFLSSNTNIDPFLLKFGALYETIKRIHFNRFNLNLKSKIKSIDRSNLKIKNILNCEIQQIEGKEYIINNLAKTPVKKASSGQQEALPLILTINNINNLKNHSGHSVYIEEPEAHLFPSSQKMIIENIMEVFNNSADHKNQFFITTHSPYVLSTMNNLILLNTLKKEIPYSILKEEFPNIKSAVSFNDISAYYISNGKSQNIKCEETETIYGEQLDEISNKISIEFDKLLNLGVEYGVF